MSRLIVSLFTPLVFLLSCSNHFASQAKSNDYVGQQLNINPAEKTADKIAFFTFKMTLTDSVSDAYQFILLNSKFAEGKLKNSQQDNESIEPYYLYVEISDNGNRRLDVVKVQNPLLRVLEYSPAGEALEKKVFKSKTGELYVRVQLSKEAGQLNIYEPSENLKTLKRIYHAQL